MCVIPLNAGGLSWARCVLTSAHPSATPEYSAYTNNPPLLNNYTFGVPTDFLPGPATLQQLVSSPQPPQRPLPGSCPGTVVAKTDVFIDQLIADGIPVIRGTDMNLTDEDYAQARRLIDTKLACDFKQSFDDFVPGLGQEVQSVEDLVNFNDLHAVSLLWIIGNTGPKSERPPQDLTCRSLSCHQGSAAKQILSVHCLWSHNQPFAMTQRHNWTNSLELMALTTSSRHTTLTLFS